MACENCTRLERMLFQLIAPGDTLQTLHCNEGSEDKAQGFKVRGQVWQSIQESFKAIPKEVRRLEKERI